ncbi:hypothetical protein CVT26_012654 [Gymnopilus dilepis]|uniref:ZMYND11/ZMYD8 MYND zinc finger domain-containing protein n=1 Tax=Gymnopilus dilepis TaxID=231916 RepID=A0A409YPY5_9AGAR|nr:hypothetical protein CVT26_012654 [Gymnopilus dilepis]
MSSAHTPRILKGQAVYTREVFVHPFDVILYDIFHLRYCSKTCQKAHWENHRDICEHNRAHYNDVTLANDAGMKVADDISLCDMDTLLSKWVKHHAFTLLGAVIHGLDLPRDIKRSHSHIIRMRLALKPKVVKSWPEVAFNITIVHALEQSKARTMGYIWEESLDKLAKMRIDNEKAGRGTVAAIFMECEPLGLHVLPFGSLKDLEGIQSLGSIWQDILLDAVDRGNRTKRFYDRYCKLGEKS